MGFQGPECLKMVPARVLGGRGPVGIYDLGGERGQMRSCGNFFRGLLGTWSEKLGAYSTFLKKILMPTITQHN